MNQSTSPDNEIECIIRDNKLFRFSGELQHTENSDRKKTLHSIIQSHQISGADDHEKIKNKLDAIYGKIDEDLLKKKWTRLSDDQRKDRLKHFIDQTVTVEADRATKYLHIVKLMDEKKLKANDVDYDTSSCKILSINYVEKVKKLKKVQKDDSTDSD